MRSGPKHLWSGDWRSEPGRAVAPRQRPPEQEPEPAPLTRRGWTRREFAIALCAAVAAAAVTVAVVASLGDLSKGIPGPGGLKRASTASGPYSASADWMGMQIGGSPTGVYINAMNSGGAAIFSGLQIGDQIVSINNHSINTVPDIRSDTNGLRIGAPVEITVMRSSVEVRSQLIPMMQRPTIHR